VILRTFGWLCAGYWTSVLIRVIAGTYVLDRVSTVLTLFIVILFFAAVGIEGDE
jgi:hypothetical protein